MARSDAHSAVHPELIVINSPNDASSEENRNVDIGLLPSYSWRCQRIKLLQRSLWRCADDSHRTVLFVPIIRGGRLQRHEAVGLI